MEVSVKMEIAARGWHVYGKTVWQSPSKGEKLTAEKEKNKEALDIDPYAMAWMLKRRNKLVPDIVGHVLCDLRHTWWKNGGKCVVCSTVTITNPNWRIRNHAYGKADNR